MINLEIGCRLSRNCQARKSQQSVWRVCGEDSLTQLERHICIQSAGEVMPLCALGPIALNISSLAGTYVGTAWGRKMYSACKKDNFAWRGGRGQCGGAASTWGIGKVGRMLPQLVREEVATERAMSKAGLVASEDLPFRGLYFGSDNQSLRFALSDFPFTLCLYIFLYIHLSTSKCWMQLGC